MPIRLKGIFFVVAASLLAVVPARGASAGEAPWRASRPEVRAEIVAAIDGQLAAFRAGDAARAYAFAAAELQVQKPLPAFAAIVRNRYPEIWTNRRAEFGLVRDDGARATVTVQVYGREADAAYDYTLKKEATGWRIFGVVRHEPKRTGKA